MNGKKILLVDDSSTTLLLEQMVLNGSGYELHTAKDGDAGVEAALRLRPDLVLLDVVMPKMDGFEVCRRLREDDSTRETPIILVTTRGEEANLEKGFEAGCNDYVLKPINAAELLAKVKNLLGE
jgi:DNA-binding response OmpR family regulator